MMNTKRLQPDNWRAGYQFGSLQLKKPSIVREIRRIELRIKKTEDRNNGFRYDEYLSEPDKNFDALLSVIRGNFLPETRIAALLHAMEFEWMEFVTSSSGFEAHIFTERGKGLYGALLEMISDQSTPPDILPVASEARSLLQQQISRGNSLFTSQNQVSELIAKLPPKLTVEILNRRLAEIAVLSRQLNQELIGRLDELSAEMPPGELAEIRAKLSSNL